ncbi:MAG: UDP-N-acetylglucosamine diphosphorylase/glucosamine-phosphate N-acetyltransferase [Pseudomonadota bacterium]
MLLDVVIMAAGKGTRMKSARPKVLHTLAGRPLLQHVLQMGAGLGAERLITVTGHGAELVESTMRAALPGAPLAFVRQEPQLGTGHAVQQAVPELPEAGTTLILNGDVPLIRAETAQALIDACGGEQLVLLTVDLDDPTGYGRIVREGEQVRAIVEHKDATPAQRAIREGYTGMMAAPTAHLKRWLANLKNDNAQKEYYLTDIVAMAVADGVPVVATRASSETEVLGVNSPLQLAQLERRFQAQQAEVLLEAGVRMMDPARFDLRGTLVCGRDVSIDVNCVFDGTVMLGDDVTIGANCCIRNATIGAGTVLQPFTHIDGEALGVTIWAPAPRCEAGRRGPHRQLRRGQELDDGPRRQGQPPCLPGRRHRRRARQLRRRQHHRQLRRRQQAPHHHRGRRSHRLQLRAGGAGHGRCGRHGRRWLDHQQGRRRRSARRRPWPPDQPQRLDPPGESTQEVSHP